MAYSLNFSLSLGSGSTGLILNSQIVNSDGTDYGSVISTGFVEIRRTVIIFGVIHSFLIIFVGGVKFFNASSPSTIISFNAINPQEAEYINAKVTDVIASGKIVVDVGNNPDSTVVEFGLNDGTETNTFNIDPGVL